MNRYASTGQAFNPLSESPPSPWPPINGDWKLVGTAACRNPHAPGDQIYLTWTWERVEGGSK